MRKIELTDKEKDEMLVELYKSFKTGFDFEDFLKPLLECLGLDEVRVTKRTGDGGVDLEGVRYGVIDNKDDSVKYIVQAKRYKPTNSVQVDVIDRLRGNMLSGEKGIVITTSRFSKPAKAKAEKRIDAPIVLIDGRTLVDICVENEIGFVFKPVFSSKELESFYRKNHGAEILQEKSADKYLESGVEKVITANDIRHNILSIPRVIFDLLPKNKKNCDVSFNGIMMKDVKINADRRFFSGVTAKYRQFGLLTDDNVCNPSKSIWKYDGKTVFIDLVEE